MTKRRTRLFSLLLAFALVLGLASPALAAGETATLSFTADTEAYNYFLFGYGYSLTDE